MFICGRKPEHTEKPHAVTGRMHKLCTERLPSAIGFNPEVYREALTAQPCCLCTMLIQIHFHKKCKSLKEPEYLYCKSEILLRNSWEKWEKFYILCNNDRLENLRGEKGQYCVLLTDDPFASVSLLQWFFTIDLCKLNKPSVTVLKRRIN